MSMIPEEPAEGTEGASRIVFRLPISGERVQRRFMLTDKVQLLYDFVETLDNLQRENEHSELVLF